MNLKKILLKNIKLHITHISPNADTIIQKQKHCLLYKNRDLENDFVWSQREEINFDIKNVEENACVIHVCKKNPNYCDF